jgi:hypothetical protein
MLETVGATGFEAHCMSIVCGYITFLSLIRNRQKSLCLIIHEILHTNSVTDK